MCGVTVNSSRCTRVGVRAVTDIVVAVGVVWVILAVLTVGVWNWAKVRTLRHAQRAAGDPVCCPDGSHRS